MDKYITFKEKDLKNTITAIVSAVHDINFWASMMQEQAEGKRENLTMEDSKYILIGSKRITELLKEFKL